MDWLTGGFISALLSIIIIDLVLAGDNAIVIGLAVRNLPKETQKRVIIWGTAGAIIIRVILTLAVAWLLHIPFLMLAGGLILIFIAYKLLVEEKKNDHVSAGKNVLDAIRTIIIADAAMGLDNVLAIAGAAHGDFLLIILGLIISVPIVVWGSTIILKWTERFPAIIYIGSGVLAYTAGMMIADEKWVKPFFTANPELKWAMIIFIISVVLIAGKIKKNKNLRPSHN